MKKQLLKWLTSEEKKELKNKIKSVRDSMPITKIENSRMTDDGRFMCDIVVEIKKPLN